MPWSLGRARKTAVVVTIVLVVAGGSLAWRATHRAVIQDCPRRVQFADICTRIYGDPHAADGLPIEPIRREVAIAGVDQLPMYPSSTGGAHKDVTAENAGRANGLLGYTGAQVVRTFAVVVKPGDLLSWYHRRMQAHGWHEQRVSYGAPQLTVRYFTRGTRERATLDIYAADYLGIRQVDYDLVYQVTPYICDGSFTCGMTVISVG